MNTTPRVITINNGPILRGELEIEVEQIDVTGTKSEPDMRWERVDRAGHFHAFAADGTLPTLDTRSEHVDCAGHSDEEDECEGYDVTVYSCAICGEIIEPKSIVTHPTFREYAPGRTTWRVDVLADIRRDAKVSVKVTQGDRVLFGVGVATTHSATDLSNGIEVTTTIVGISPLGQRKARGNAGVAA